ncbi:MAG: hypothetical protein AAFQ94_28390, partial [Bacteroidota bacterium]
MENKMYFYDKRKLRCPGNADHYLVSTHDSLALVVIRMRIGLIILTLFLGTGLFGQNPADSILISLKRQFNLTEYDRPTERIEFNKGTIIIAGFLADLSLSEPRYEQKKNVIYKTTNGGEKWIKIKFKGDAWIYDTYHKNDGKIWMGGSDNVIHYSDDFGETWERKIKPFEPVKRDRTLLTG